MKLVLFDIDGTLTHTNDIDGQAFQYACTEVLGLQSPTIDWSAYRYSTDTGIFDEIFERKHQRKPLANEVAEFRDCFLAHLEKLYASDPSRIRALEGAQDLCHWLNEKTDWRSALATGAWNRSALFKLSKAEINFNGIPAAFAEDAFERAEIIRTSWNRAKQNYGENEYTKIVYVGDGIWDLKAARALGIGFVGTTTNQGGAHFVGQASHRIDHYALRERVLESLEACRVP